MWDNAALLRSTANALIGFSVFAVLYGAAYYAVHLPGLFPLHSVRLSAAPQRVVAPEVLQVVRNEVDGNFFTVDIERLRQSLEKLPWVRSVSIRREFPSRLAVQMEEHQVLARWNSGARFDPSTASGQALLRTGLVNTQGEVFSAESERVMPEAAPRPGEVRVSGGVPLAGASGTHRPPLYGGSGQVLPSFIGQDGTSAEVARNYAQFSEQLAALNLQVAQLALSPRHAWQLRLSNGMVLELGREDMQQRLARFVAAYPYTKDRIQKAENSGAAYVDLRYHNGFAVGGG